MIDKQNTKKGKDGLVQTNEESIRVKWNTISMSFIIIIIY